MPRQEGRSNQLVPAIELPTWLQRTIADPPTLWAKCVFCHKNSEVFRTDQEIESLEPGELSSGQLTYVHVCSDGLD